MKLFLLQKRADRHKNFVDSSEGNPIDPWEDPYDCMHSLVVRAENEEKARNIAAQLAGDEDWVMRYGDYYDGVWTNPELTECEEIDGEGEEGLVVRNYKNG